MEVTNLGDATLHDQEIRIVDVQLNALKEILDSLLSRLVPIQQVFRYVGERNLPSSVG